MCDVDMEFLIVDACILCTLWVLYALRVHQCTQRAVDLDNGYSCLVNIVDMDNPTIFHLVTEAIRDPPQSVFDFVLLHVAWNIFVFICSNNKINV